MWSSPWSRCQVMNGHNDQSSFEHPERVFVISGPSGVGKNSLVRALRERGAVVRAVTATDRPARPGERDGDDYHFLSHCEFERWRCEGRLLEHICYCGHCYGTPIFSVNEATRSGNPVVLVIDVEGALELKGKWPELRLIFLLPPDEQALLRRLRARGHQDQEALDSRLKRAREEIALSEHYGWRVTNDRLEDAVEEVAGIIAQQWDRQTGGTA